MKPLAPATRRIPPRRQFLSDLINRHGCSVSDAKRQWRRLKQDAVFKNDLYTVAVDQNDCPGWIHLSIKRNDKQPIHDWRDLQEIKNQLLGPEAEALELYPAESRLLDVANQFHLWARADGAKLGVGYLTKRAVQYESRPGDQHKQRQPQE